MSSSLNNTPIFREYIGVKPFPKLDDFPDIVYSAKEEFHFILGIGTESYTTDGKGLGHFTPTWNVEDFNIERVLAIKKKYSNVKVILSFGGLGGELPFNPKDKAIWSTAAYNSIKGIIQKYYQIEDPETKTIINTIDGIDINYEYITPGILDDATVFTLCIGELITRLREDPDLSLNTFSISPSKLVLSQYESLYSKYKSAISWINYQFYLQRVFSVGDFVKLYHELVNKHIFPQSKLLPGVSTDPKYAGNIDPNVFIAGITKFHKENVLAGAFVWNANDSSVPPNPGEEPFYLEIIIQDILTGGGVTA